jgi:hypothetical protein
MAQLVKAELTPGHGLTQIHEAWLVELFEAISMDENIPVRSQGTFAEPQYEGP